MEEQALTQKREYHISAEESDRIRILKMWFAVMVVSIHAYIGDADLAITSSTTISYALLKGGQYLTSQVVGRCAVPGFFFLSAMFLYRKEFSWRENVRKKFRSLMIPYLLISVIWTVIYYFAQRVDTLHIFSMRPGMEFERGLEGWINAIFGLDVRRPWDNHAPLVGPLWFIRNLFVLNLLAVLIKKAVDRAPRIVFLGLVILEAFNLTIPIAFFERDALVFFCLGYYFVKYDLHLKDVDRIDPVLLCGLYGIGAVLDCLMHGGATQYLVRIATIILGAMFFFRFMTNIPNAKWKKRLLSLSGYAMPIYLFHQQTLMILQNLMFRYLTTAYSWLAFYIGSALTVICLGIAVSWVLQHIAPRFYALLTGGRTK